MADVCALVEGRWVDWPGLTPFPIAEAPACLTGGGAVQWLQFAGVYRPYRVFHHAMGEVSLFWFEDDLVRLIEVFPSAVPDGWQELGEPDCWVDVSLASRFSNPERLTGAGVREAVFAARGLALVVAGAEVKRIRGFEPMPPEAYRREFSDPPVRFFPD